MTITLTRMNQTRRGYTKRDEHQISLSPQGQADIELLIEDFRTSKHPAKALSFGVYEDGEMSGATWRRSTALVLDFATNGSEEQYASIITAATRLGTGLFLLTGQDRYGNQTFAVIVPLTEHVSRERYARLVYVVLEEMKAGGCATPLIKGTSAMTHQMHLRDGSEAEWIEGPALNPTLKIRATRTAAQDVELDRFTIGAQAAVAQLAAPTYSYEPGLFEGL